MLRTSQSREVPQKPDRDNSRGGKIPLIRIKLNGQSKALEAALTLDRLLHLLELQSSNIAVAVNFDVIPRSEFPKKTVKDGDSIDIVNPVAGG